MEFPWVVETREPPKSLRNPVWGILALVAAVICGAFFLLGIAATFAGVGDWVGSLLPAWGIVTLAAIVLAITAAMRRGTANVTLAVITGAIVLISNPVLFLVMGLALSALA